MHKSRLLWVIVLSIYYPFSSVAQDKNAPKYPSLLWEITGNGLAKPSYLFGTMHVSSKLAFNLSDSFYLAIKNVDVVALELNPDTWQEQMVSMNQAKQNYSEFVKKQEGDYLNENSFRLQQYDDDLKLAMSSEPTIVNNLLYRTYKAKEDFEEDTFLDLYIYQIGKKLGKKTTGVENYFETEKIIMEAYTDMADEKKKNTIDIDSELKYGIREKIQDAYRRGDLDLMDSLDRLVDRSAAFTEKFLYKRNEIQANSIDTVLRKNSLFVGIGAAHLPGNRGVIELLRKKGYVLRPVFMTNRNASQKELIDRLKVPVVFTTQRAEDGFYTVSVPGPLFKMPEDYRGIERRQYADMGNGAYYLVTRVHTYSAFLGQNQKDVLKKTDSILYENIPGKILFKKNISKDGYPGYDITSRTRRGDVQRYHIFITPFEVLLFKMSGKENYVSGKEAQQFFSSIRMQKPADSAVLFKPVQGGFIAQFPHYPKTSLNTFCSDAIDRWEYEALDKTNGNVYLLFKKSVYNFSFLGEDTFDLNLIEESFRNPAFFVKQQARQYGIFKGYPCLNAQYQMKGDAIVHAKYIIQGPHYYVLAVRSHSNSPPAAAFFNSFQFVENQYSALEKYTDTFMHFAVTTPVVPEIKDDIRQQMEKMLSKITETNYRETNSYWPEPRNALFKNNATGEIIYVDIQEYPRYYYINDSTAFWEKEINEKNVNADMVLYKKNPVWVNNEVKGYHYFFRDTGSSRTIHRLVMLKDNYVFNIVSMGDTLSTESRFTHFFFNSFVPEEKKLGRNMNVNNTNDFFEDLFSTDSTVRTRAQQFIDNIQYSEKEIPHLLATIARLNSSYDNYWEVKAKLIAELGYIKDTILPVVVNSLKKIYTQTADTSLFQNEVFFALARHKTKASYSLLKELILLDPPVFETNYSYGNLFDYLEDSLLLAGNLFPELMNLSPVDDYKNEVLSLLATLVDSNIIRSKDYADYFPRIFFDAKIELKKQRVKDEKIMKEEVKKNTLATPASGYNIKYAYDNNRSNLYNYSILLLPFYDKDSVRLFFHHLLQTKDQEVQLQTTILLLRNNKNVPDDILEKLAAQDKFRSTLLVHLEKAGHLDKFPVKYKNQLDISRSFLVADKEHETIDSVIFLYKQPVFYHAQKGLVYFFKYRIKKEDNWKIAISGLQPENEKDISSNNTLMVFTDKRIRTDEALDDQLQQQLKKILYSSHKSGKNFYDAVDYYKRLEKLLQYYN